MTPIIVLAVWSSIGILLAVRTAPAGESGIAWAPIASILGPLWAPVALDRRMIAEDEAAWRDR